MQLVEGSYSSMNLAYNYLVPRIPITESKDDIIGDDDFFSNFEFFDTTFLLCPINLCRDFRLLLSGALRLVTQE
jgi:hypothetical protein